MEKQNEAREQIRELALTLSLIDVEILLGELRDQVQGHRQRNRILDTQIEHFHGLIGRLEAIAEAWEYQVRRVADISYLDIQLQKLTAAILQEHVDTQRTRVTREPWNGEANRGARRVFKTKKIS